MTLSEHDLFETGDIDAPECVKDRNGEVVLGLCRVCNQAEAELEDTCPGHRQSVKADAA